MGRGPLGPSEPQEGFQRFRQKEEVHEKGITPV